MPLIDLHCDTITEVCRDGNSLRNRAGHLNLERMKTADYMLQTFAMYVNLGQYGEDPYGRCHYMIDRFEQEMDANADLIGHVRSYEDIVKNREAGRMSALLSIEEGETCLRKIEHLQEFYDRGVRMMTLTWNFANSLGWPNHLEGRYGTPELEHGLTETGIQFVEEAERLGIILDVSHLGDAGFDALALHTKRPFIASHSNARGYCPHMRNLDDARIRTLAERGGVMGLNFFGKFTDPKPEGWIADYRELAAMAKYMVNAAGIEGVALGSDFDGIHPDSTELQGVQDVPRLMEELKKGGFSESDIDKISHQNALRVFKEML